MQLAGDGSGSWGRQWPARDFGWNRVGLAQTGISGGVWGGFVQTGDLGASGGLLVIKVNADVWYSSLICVILME